MDSATLAQSLLSLLEARCAPPARAWLEAGLRGKNGDLAGRFAAAGRRLGRAALAPDAAEQARLRAAGLDGPLEAWGVDDAARAFLLLSAAARLPAPRLETLLAELHRFGDDRERAALARVAPLLPRPARGLPPARRAAGEGGAPPRRAPRCARSHIEPLARMSRRSAGDYAAMAGAGAALVVEPYGGGPPRTRLGAIEDDYGALLRHEPARARAHGIEHRCALGLGGREAGEAGLLEGALWLLPRLLERDGVVAVGELGLDEGTREEEEALALQLELARRHGLPVLVRAPAHDARLFERTLGLLAECRVPAGGALVCGMGEPALGAVLDAGFWAAATLGPALAPRAVPALARRWGRERLLLTGEPGGTGGDPLAVAAAARALRQSGLPEAEVSALVWGNPAAFFGERLEAA